MRDINSSWAMRTSHSTTMTLIVLSALSAVRTVEVDRADAKLSSSYLVVTTFILFFYRNLYYIPHFHISASSHTAYYVCASCSQLVRRHSVR
ncbi:hypothetical protein V8E53_006707 [Lactarius tabidus]